MIAIRRSTSPSQESQCTPNVLPCRVHHTGAVDASKRHWNPKPSEEDGADLEAYFRGRKLKGKQVRMPEGYKGFVVREGPMEGGNEGRKEKVVTDGHVGVDANEESEDMEEETKVLEEVATFEEVVVWGHDKITEGNDVFVKGIAEWIPFAEIMHSIGSESVKNERTSKQTD